MDAKTYLIKSASAEMLYGAVMPSAVGGMTADQRSLDQHTPKKEHLKQVLRGMIYGTGIGIGGATVGNTIGNAIGSSKYIKNPLHTLMLGQLGQLGGGALGGYIGGRVATPEKRKHNEHQA